LKFGIYVHPKRPKLPVEQIMKKLQSAGATYSPNDPDIAIVVGGDGTFGYYGRTLALPLLFVGVRESDILGSKAKLAEVMFDDLKEAVQDIESGRYLLTKRSMIRVSFKGKSTDVLTDVYLERGLFSGCLRYVVSVAEKEKRAFSEYAIGNGVIFSTDFGSRGYYSYPDRLTETIKGAEVHEERIGICHIMPIVLIREKNNRRRSSQNLRYTVPFRSRIQVTLSRDTNTRLYGTTVHSCGVAVKYGDTVVIGASERKAIIIKLSNGTVV
jgi:hypothetical protein